MAELDEDFDLGAVPAKAVADRVRLALQELLQDAGTTQETLANVMEYKTQGSVSKILNERQALLVPKAVLLDEAGYSTNTRYTFEELAKVWEQHRRRPDRRRPRRLSYDIFLASPMASAEEYKTSRNGALKFACAIEDWTGFSVYYAGLEIHDPDSFDAPDVAFNENYDALERSRHFVLYLPKPLSKPSSVWVEAGMALAMNMDSTYFVSDHKALPYILNRAVQPESKGGSAIVAVHWLAGNERLPFNLVERHKADLFRHKGPRTR